MRIAAAHALAVLGICDASKCLNLLAQREELAVDAGLNVNDTLSALAEQGWAEAYDCLMRLAQQAGRQAVRREACSALAHLDDPWKAARSNAHEQAVRRPRGSRVRQLGREIC